MISIRPLIHPCTCKMSLSIFSAIGKLGKGFLSNHTIIERTNEGFFVARVSAYHAYNYFVSPIEPGAYPLFHYCRFPGQNIQI